MRLLDMVQLSFDPRMLMPEIELAPVPKKSNMLLLSIKFSLLMATPVPIETIACEGKLEPAGPMLHRETVFASLPVVTLEPNTMVPAMTLRVEFEEPRMVHRVTVLFVASPVNWTVDVPDVAETLVLEIINEFPPVLMPSSVTLSAPLKLISGLPAVVEPAIVRAPLGLMVKDAHDPPDGWFKAAVAVPSFVSPRIVT